MLRAVPPSHTHTLPATAAPAAGTESLAEVLLKYITEQEQRVESEKKELAAQEEKLAALKTKLQSLTA